MAFSKRIVLFLLTNFLIIMTVSILLKVFGFEGYLTSQGISYRGLLLFCSVWGMGGAFISLWLSRWMAKRAMGVHLIDPKQADGQSLWLYETVSRLSRSAGLPAVPEVGIYESPEVNAFATGPSKRSALVAVSRGLLDRMKQDQIEGVLGHEMAHIANGDMVTMTLLQGVINAFVMFLARVIAYAIMTMGKGDRDDNRGFSYLSYILTVWVLEFVFMILGSLVTAWFSRYREFRADTGGARFAGREKMISALKALQNTVELEAPNKQQASSLNAFKISHRPSWLALFSTHPPLKTRIKHLETLHG